MTKARLHSLIALSSLTLAIGACSSQPIIPDAKNIKLSRENAAKDCREIGPVQGTVSTNRGTIEQAIENMKLDAARKGANYVHMESAGAMGTSVSGTAYQCP
jgi:nucleoside phosphorylase